MDGGAAAAGGQIHHLISHKYRSVAWAFKAHEWMQKYSCLFYLTEHSH